MAKSKIEPLLSSGEVILIETQQHWMAALRYALRPILIGLVAVLLVAINNWLSFSDDSFFSFVNDLITWIAVIMIIVTVIWLPIDLIRWDTRRYGLTNRRAIRTEGLMRHSTFDSSLEQINDIALEESFLGRQLDYADLTILTASDTANETYEQLRDGAKFKIAVLDAKEAVRRGQPLMVLPPDFIVRGGTNVASMQADGKLVGDDGPAETAAADTSAAAASQPAAAPPPPATAQPVAPAQPEAAAPPEPVVAAEPVAPPPPPEPEPEPQVTASAPEAVTEPAVVADSDTPADQPVADTPEPEPVDAEGPDEAPAAAAPDETAASAWPAADTASSTSDATSADADGDADTDRPAPKSDGPTSV